MNKFSKKQEYADQMEATAKKVLKVIGFVILGFAVVLGIGFAVKFLWNSLMPDLFGLKEITYWQGVGLLVLSKIFFGGFGNTSSKNSDSKSSEVRGTIGQAIHEEMQQEFYKEYDKKYSEEHSTSENDDQEKLYEKWWAKEGETKFLEYLGRIEKEES